MESSSNIAFVFLTIAIISALNLCSGNVEVLCKESERQALLRFKEDLKDPMNRLISWDGETNCCSWTGVACHNKTGHVFQLQLHDLGLSGKINPSLLSLKHLNYLDLSLNDFEGIQIPSFIGSLKSLTHLDFSYAGFGGIIPHQLGNLSNLRYLDLNDLYGLYMTSLQFIGGLSSLQYLDMSQVSLRNASDWLQMLNDLPSLVELRLQSCDIGNIPTDVPAVINFTSLTTLDLSGNSNLGPSKPRWISNLNSLDSLYLQSIFLEGSFPFGPTNMTSSLKILDLSNNPLDSIISDWMCRFNRLESLNLFRSSLVGNIPSDIGNLTSIRVLDLSYNNLEGEIPNSLGNLCRLKELSLYMNNLNGSLSEVFERWSRCTMNSIESMRLFSNKFSGELPNHLGRLTNLVTIDVSGNLFSGPIPASIGKSSSLQYLDASSNQLNGSLPESFGQLVKLKELYMPHNQLSGSLPESFGQLVRLEELVISNNSFKGVLSEVHFINLTSLKRLEASRNSLTLKTSPSWVPPFQLELLNLNSWYLGPKLPAWFRWQKKLSELHISNTRISDSLPTWFCNFSSHLGYLNLSHNQFHGEFPCTIHSLSNIDLSSNLFNGSLPLLSPSVSDTLDFSNNLFSGSVFHFFCIESDVQGFSHINLGNNLLSGAIPKCWKEWESLVFLNLRDNNLDGVLPSSMGYLASLMSLHLSNNNLSGELPLSLRKCTSMNTLDISENKFSGRIPKWIGASMSQLKILILRSNKFEGDIPLELCSLQNLQILDMANNNISGTIPKCFYNLSAMTTLGNSVGTSVSYGGFSGNSDNFDLSDDVKLVIKGREVPYSSILGLVRLIDLSDNNIQGGFAMELTRLIQLQTFNLSNNHLTGKIPSKIGHMRGLESLDLSRNQLYGEIPPSIINLTFLSYLDLSYNNFTGPIPTSTQLQSFDESSFIGNHLCGPPLHQNCSATQPTPTPGKQGGQGFFIDKNYLYLSLGLGFAFGFWGLLGSLFFNTRWSIAYCRFLDRIVLKIYAVILENF